jgi:DNA (cytosine-5)-methyltransferase 1
MLWFTKSRRAQNVDDYETWIEGGVMPTMNAFDNGDVRTTVMVMGTLQARDYKGVGNQYVEEGKLIMGTNVRRLTPIECERLQGFPDDWTAGQSDSTRYKQMGNAVAVPVVEWIVQNIVDVAKVS